jgi:hypothetical protein
LKASLIIAGGLLGGVFAFAAAPSMVGAVPAELREKLHLSSFYSRHLDALEIPILASSKTSEVALLETRYLIENMIGSRPDIAKAIADAGVRVAIMSCTEMTTDIPEHSDLEPASYWDRRARGLGATRQRPAVSCGEENLLCCKGDPYAAENIFIHEFGHVIHEIGMAKVDPTFDDRLNAAYKTALDEGLWKGKYAATNRSEYWAEGVQSWFDTNREDDHDHNHVNTRTELKEYDPRLAALCLEVLGDGEWKYVRPADRKPASDHFAGFDATTAPVFAWPEKAAQ